LTKLYEIFILNTIKRHASITGNDSITVGLCTLAEIPESFQKHLNALGKLAYHGLVADKMMFSVKDIKCAFPKCSYLDISNNLLSLMTALKWFTTTGEELSYQFLHLTIQEFLAASWAASQLSNGQLLKFFQDHLREDRYRMVLLFLAGISQLRFTFADNLFQDELNFESPYTPYRTQYSNEKVVDYFLFLAHLIYESQTFSLFHNLASKIVGATLIPAFCELAPFDCLVLAYFLAWCDCSLKLLDLSGCGLTNQSLEIIHRVNLEHHGTTQIEYMDLSYNLNIITKLSLLSELPMFEHTKALEARGLHPKGKCVDILCLLNMRHLTTLEISTIKHPDLDTVIYLSFYTFQFQNGNIDSQNAVNIFRSLEHNTSPLQLDLSGNWQLAEGDSEGVGCAIERMLNVNSTLNGLNLSDCRLTNEVASYFANGLAQNHSVRSVILRSNNIGSGGAVSIFRSLEHNTSLVELDLSGNCQLAKVDSEAVGCAIERMLNVNRTLQELNLSGCNVADAVVEHIVTGLTKNTSLRRLRMGSTKLSGSCAVSLFQQMTSHPTLSITVGEVNVLGVGRVKIDQGSLLCVLCDTIHDNCVEFFRALINSGLKVLILNVQDLTDKTADHFAVALAESQPVQALKLEHRNISSVGAVSVFRSLEHNTTLEELDLSESWQLAGGDSGAVGCAIERMLKVNRTLKVLKLSHCKIDTTVATHVASGLTHNTSLVELIIGVDVFSRNNITSEGCVHVFKALRNNISLKNLEITGFDLEMEGSVALAEMLLCNKSLIELNLRWYLFITRAGFREMARGLLQNITLQTLTLWLAEEKTILETEIEWLKKSGNFTHQSSSRLEIKTHTNRVEDIRFWSSFRI